MLNAANATVVPFASHDGRPKEAIDAIRVEPEPQPRLNW
jgi:hypothetical protein